VKRAAPRRVTLTLATFTFSFDHPLAAVRQKAIRIVHSILPVSRAHFSTSSRSQMLRAAISTGSREGRISASKLTNPLAGDPEQVRYF
jgi:hypothetical protein